MTSSHPAPISEIELAGLRRKANEQLKAFNLKRAPEDGMYAAETWHALGLALLDDEDIEAAADALDCAAATYREVNRIGPNTDSAHITMVGIHAVVLSAAGRNLDALTECEYGLELVAALSDGPAVSGPYAQTVYDLHSTRWPLLDHDEQAAQESAMTALSAARHLLKEGSINAVVFASAVSDVVTLDADSSDIGGNTALLREAFDALMSDPDVAADGWCAELENIAFDLLDAEGDESFDSFDLIEADRDDDPCTVDGALDLTEFLDDEELDDAEFDDEFGDDLDGDVLEQEMNDADSTSTDLDDDETITAFEALSDADLEALLDEELSDGELDDLDEDDVEVTATPEQLDVTRRISDAFEAATPHEERDINSAAVFWHLTHVTLLIHAQEWDSAHAAWQRARQIGPEHVTAGSAKLFIAACRFIRAAHNAERQDLASGLLDDAVTLSESIEKGNLTEINSLIDLSEHLQAAERLDEALSAATSAAHYARARYDEHDAQSAFVFQESLERVIAVKSQMMQPTLGTPESAELKAVTDRIEEMLEEFAD